MSWRVYTPTGPNWSHGGERSAITGEIDTYAEDSLNIVGMFGNTDEQNQQSESPKLGPIKNPFARSGSTTINDAFACLDDWRSQAPDSSKPQSPKKVQVRHLSHILTFDHSSSIDLVFHSRSSM